MLLKEAYAKYGEIFDFAPRSWIFTRYSKNLVLKSEQRRREERLQRGDEKEVLWIGKPSSSSRGRGIVITANLEDFDSFLVDYVPNRQREEPQGFFLLDTLKNKTKNNTNSEIKENSGDQTASIDTNENREMTENREMNENREMTENLEMKENIVDEDSSAPTKTVKPFMTSKPNNLDLIVIQEYLTNPHLIAGYKYDLRIYVVVKSFCPLVAYIYEDGLVRFCSKPYSNDDMDLLRHLTNSSIQQKVARSGHLTEEEEKAFHDAIVPVLGPGDFAKRSIRSLFKHLQNIGVDYEKVWQDTIDVINLSLLSLVPTVKSDSSEKFCFELFGFDVLLTDELKPKLIEVNLAPSLAVAGPTDNMVKQPLVSDMLDLIFGPEGNNPSTIPPLSHILTSDKQDYTHSVGGFSLIFPFNQTTREVSQFVHDVENSVKSLVKEVEKKRTTVRNTE